MTHCELVGRRTVAVLATLVLVGSVSSRAGASGFALRESSARLMATTFAGSAALAEDATTGFYNVAGLTRIREISLAATITDYLLTGEFEATSSTNFGMPVTGERTVDPSRDAYVPSVHAAYRLHDRWVLGLGLTVPFGLESKYPADSVVRYLATKSILSTYNINPMIAYRINEQWSVGVGFNAQYLEAKLEQKFQLPPDPNDADILVRLSDWGFGANAGVLFEPSDRARFGVSYRSQISFDLSGPVQLGGFPGLTDGKVDSSVTMPDNVTASAVVYVLPELALLGSLTWTNWSVFDQLDATFDNGLPPLTIEENFRDTWFGALGASYDINRMWSVRMGFAFDQAAVSDKHRTVRIPDTNRWLLGAGVGIQPLDEIVFDFGYMHIFAEDGSINETALQPGSPNVRGNIRDSRGDLIAFQVTYNFGPPAPF